MPQPLLDSSASASVKTRVWRLWQWKRCSLTKRFRWLSHRAVLVSTGCKLASGSADCIKESLEMLAAQANAWMGESSTRTWPCCDLTWWWSFGTKAPAVNLGFVQHCCDYAQILRRQHQTTMWVYQKCLTAQSHIFSASHNRTCSFSERTILYKIPLPTQPPFDDRVFRTKCPWRTAVCYKV